jgi:hypothetical protein
LPFTVEIGHVVGDDSPGLLYVAGPRNIIVYMVDCYACSLNYVCASRDSYRVNVSGLRMLRDVQSS